MSFWEAVANSTDVKSIHDVLHSLKTAAAGILHLTG
jgi:hypothetical protein